MIDADIEIEKSFEEGMPVIYIGGRIVSSVVGKIEEAVNVELEKSKDLILDFRNVDFIASAGIRLILTTSNKIEEKQGSFILRQVKDVVLEVLEMTGLTAFLTIQ